MKILSILIIAVTLVSMVSALSVSPTYISSNIDIGSYKTYNLTIYSERDSTVNLSTDNKNCIISPDIFNINSGTTIKPINLTISADSSTANLDCWLSLTFLTYPDTEIKIQKEYVYSGGGIIYRNITVEKQINNTSNNTIYLNNSENPINNPKKAYSWLYILIIFLAICGIIINIVIFFKNRKAKELKEFN